MTTALPPTWMVSRCEGTNQSSARQLHDWHRSNSAAPGRRALAPGGTAPRRNRSTLCLIARLTMHGTCCSFLRSLSTAKSWPCRWIGCRKPPAPPLITMSTTERGGSRICGLDVAGKSARTVALSTRTDTRVGVTGACHCDRGMTGQQTRQKGSVGDTAPDIDHELGEGPACHAAIRLCV